MVKQVEDWPWSSAKAHVTGKNIILANTKHLLDIVNKPWKNFLSSDVEKSEIELFRKHERTGRPLGDSSFVDQLAITLGRRLKPRKPGPKRRNK